MLNVMNVAKEFVVEGFEPDSEFVRSLKKGEFASVIEYIASDIALSLVFGGCFVYKLIKESGKYKVIRLPCLELDKFNSVFLVVHGCNWYEDLPYDFHCMERVGDYYVNRCEDEVYLDYEAHERVAEYIADELERGNIDMFKKWLEFYKIEICENL